MLALVLGVHRTVLVIFAGGISLLWMGATVIARELDLRQMTDASGAAEISFCARPSPNKFGLPGHAFVAFSITRANGGREFRSVGHTVTEGGNLSSVVFSYFGSASVAGKQMEERYTSVKQDCLTVKVNKPAYEIALKAAQPTLANLGVSQDVAASAERYSLGRDDCVTFAHAVALSLQQYGLKVPTRGATDTPQAWIAKLKEAN